MTGLCPLVVTLASATDISCLYSSLHPTILQSESQSPLGERDSPQTLNIGSRTELLEAVDRGFDQVHRVC